MGTEYGNSTPQLSSRNDFFTFRTDVVNTCARRKHARRTAGQATV
jgi:hypothetical protein